MTKKKPSKFSDSFYKLALFIFGFISGLLIILSIISGFTDQRIALLLLNMWFILFTIDIIAGRFKVDDKGNFWKNWALFSIKQKPAYAKIKK